MLSSGSLSTAEFAVTLCRAAGCPPPLENLRGSTSRPADPVLNTLRLARLLLADPKTLPSSFQR